METDGIAKHDARVADTLDDDRKVVLNIGEEQGVTEGERYVVFELGREVKDPETDESLGRLELVKGKGKVVHVQPKICFIETYEYDIRKVKTNPAFRGALTAMGIPEEKKVKKYETFENVNIGDYARKQGGASASTS